MIEKATCPYCKGKIGMPVTTEYLMLRCPHCKLWIRVFRELVKFRADKDDTANGLLTICQHCKKGYSEIPAGSDIQINPYSGLILGLVKCCACKEEERQSLLNETLSKKKKESIE